ncbi:MAG: hypothetical protein RIB67_05160 [Miltoncostaeaceae bacterium]
MATSPQSTAAGTRPAAAEQADDGPVRDGATDEGLADALAALDALREVLAPDVESPSPRVGVLAEGPAADFTTEVIRREVRARSRGARVVAVDDADAGAADLDVLLCFGADPPATDTAALRLDAEGDGPLALAARLVDADQLSARAAVMAARGVPAAAGGAICLVVDGLSPAVLGSVVGAAAALERDLGRSLTILPAELDPEGTHATLALMRHLGLPATTPRAVGPEETLAAIAACQVVVGAGAHVRALSSAGGRSPLDPTEAGGLDARLRERVEDPGSGGARADEASLDRLLDRAMDTARAAAARHRPTRTAERLAERADELVDHVVGLERGRARAVERLAEERRELTAFAERMRRAAESGEERAVAAEDGLRRVRERVEELESALAHTNVAVSRLQTELSAALADARAETTALRALRQAAQAERTPLQVLAGALRRMRALVRR